MQEANWPGRMECICKKPCIYIDGAHNWPAVKQLQKTLDANFTNKTITYIIVVLADKDVAVTFADGKSYLYGNTEK